MADRKISTKIATSFATMPAITMPIAGVAYVEFDMVASHVGFYSRMVRDRAAIDEADRQFLAPHRFVGAGTTRADCSQATPVAAINNDPDWKVF